MLVVCWGELLWDLFPSGPELGGAAANVAINLPRLGATPLLVSRVGKDALGALAYHLVQGSNLKTIAEAASDHARRVASAHGAFGFVA